MTGDAFAVVLPRRRPFTGFDAARFERAARDRGLTVHCLQDGSLVASSANASVTGHAAVIGVAFAEGESRAEALPGVCAKFASHGPARFVRSHWGSYIALRGSQEGQGPIVLRAPFGDLPCFWVECESHVVAASSLALLQAFGIPRPSVDWRETVKFLLATEMRGEATGLEGIRELPGGSVLEVTCDGGVTRPVWSPWRIAGVERPLNDPIMAAAELGAAVHLAIAARGRQAHRSVLLLSGGIDSSCVAAGLSAAGCEFASLNMVTRERSGDERAYARAVAHATGSPLTECQRSAAEIDWADATPGRLPRPTSRLFRQPTLGAARRLADDYGAEVIVDGGGGDNVFCSLHSVAPLLDRTRLEGCGAEAWQTAREIALLTDVGLGKVVRKAALRHLTRRVRYRWPIERGFLADLPGALIREAGRHPWLEPPPGALPGQAAHVALILGSLALAEDDSTSETIRTMSPLVSQPVVETALRVRSWLWFEHGRNRAVIRRAFAGRLPALVLERHGKGTPTGFMAEVMTAHRSQIRDLLRGGLLARHGIIDSRKVQAYLSIEGPPRDFDFARILQLLDAERWARSWA